MILGVVFGLIINGIGTGSQFTRDWISPFGEIFINLLKLIAVPIVIISLAKGITDLKSLSTLTRIGGRSILLFAITTIAAVLIGLALVNILRPGGDVEIGKLEELSGKYEGIAVERIDIKQNADNGPLDFFVNLVPENFVDAASNNSDMLQVIFFTVFFSICLLLIAPDRQQPLIDLFDIINEVLLKMVDVIMWFAPYAVFALMASLVIETSDPALFYALMNYALILVGGMILILILYVAGIAVFTKMKPLHFVRGILPAQLVALTTSSSMATLPVTMECVEDNLKVEKEVSSFVCPVGATLNMDSTSLMQAIAAVFVCQVVGYELTLTHQLTIVLTASLASIGAAGAPSAGIVMLIMVLESIGFPSEHLPFAIAMILAVDRPLDMGRTVVNITGDSFVSVLVNQSLDKHET